MAADSAGLFATLVGEDRQRGPRGSLRLENLPRARH